MQQNKLYGLFIVSAEHVAQRFYAGSNDISKLIKVTPNQSMWITCNDPNDQTLRRKTEEGRYPMYLVREVPYVC